MDRRPIQMTRAKIGLAVMVAVAMAAGLKSWVLAGLIPGSGRGTSVKAQQGNVPLAVERDVSGGSGNGSYATSFLLSMAVRSSARMRAARSR